MKKRILIILLSIIIISGCFIYIKFKIIFNINGSKEDIVYYSSKINGNTSVFVDVNSKYRDEGATEIIDGKKYIMSTNGYVNTEKIGTYLIEYVPMNPIYPKLYREVIVQDNESPIINLKGSKEKIIYIGEKYIEPGYTVTDNYDSGLENNVKVSGMVNCNKTGTYKLIYSVVDSSNNRAETYRNVIVKQKESKKIINSPIIKKVTKTMSIEKGSSKVTKVDVSAEPNSTIMMKFTNSGITINGYVKNGSGKYTIKLCDGTNCVMSNMLNKKNYYYSGNINLESLPIGNYKMYISDNGKDMLVINKLKTIERINRTKIGDKLVTLSYNNDNITISVKPFSYEYDILLDAGHGGNDPGASNKYITEKLLNLTQTLYEMKRYEQHGLNVKMIRTDDTYGLMMGPSTESNIRRRAYAIGYYGVVSKYIYSNHHNSIGDKKYTGWEIIMANQATKSINENAYKVADYWKKIYPIMDTHIRIYGRNYDTDSLLNKEVGQIYNIKNYYAVQRIPYELFNLDSVITYEGCYLSNIDDYNWYINNWKQLSEAKIKIYVESLGKEYIQPTD